jgi:hypothetical protein
MDIIHTHCCYCRRKFSDTVKMLQRTIDHFYPTSRSGNNNKENKLQCCYECNQWKAARLPNDFLKTVIKHFEIKRRRGTYIFRDFAQIIGSLKYFIKIMKDKNISDYKL